MSARAAFVFDAERCTACEACRIACGIENAAGGDTGWRQVLSLNPARHPALPTRHLSLACNHCDTPACLLACPALAYRRDAATGAVLLEAARCIGCRYCSWVCPYDAPRFDAAAGVMTKCTLCAPRVTAGGQPACTLACPTGALAFGTRPDGAPEAHGIGVPETGLGPALVLVPPRRAVVATAHAGMPPAQPPPPRKLSLRSEWSLIAFTLVLPLLVACFGAGLLRPERRLPPAVFLAAGGAVMALSVLHLGRPLRAWRAVLNLRTSWLSREIVLGMLFLALGGAYLLGSWTGLGPVALLVGGALCMAIDGVYRVLPRASGRGWHSAQALPTLALELGLATGMLELGVAAAVFKALLFGRRWRAGRLGLPRSCGALRLALLVAALVSGRAWLPALALAAAGEVLDRLAFYAELEPTTPARRLVEDALRLARAA